MLLKLLSKIFKNCNIPHHEFRFREKLVQMQRSRMQQRAHDAETALNERLQAI